MIKRFNQYQSEINTFHYLQYLRLVVDSLFIVAPIVCGGSVFGPSFVMQYFVSFWFCNGLDEEKRAGCFTLIAFLIPCACWCSVSLPYSAVGCSAVCDCGISLSYSLTFLQEIMK